MLKNLLLISFICLAGNSLAQVSQVDTTILTNTQADTSLSNFNIPVFSANGTDIDSDMGQQESSSLLQSSRDLFAQFTFFHFNSAHYRIRGLQAENLQTMINGVIVNNVETGNSDYTTWNGLNGQIQFSEYRVGNGSSRYGFSGAGGYNNTESRASSFRKGTRISLSTTNRTYRERFNITYATGLMKNGWAFRVIASGSNGNQVYIPGTYIKAYSLNASIDKKINDKHLLSLTGIGGYTERGAATVNQLEAYQLAGSNYYNAAWGYQNGQIRNAAVTKTNKPLIMLAHIWTPNTTTKLTTTVFFGWGKTSQSALNWNNSSIPFPTYYKYLPSYYYNQGIMDQGDALAAMWHANGTPGDDTRQINWDGLINLNRSNLYTIPGQPVNTTETRSRYILENRIQDTKRFGFNSVLNKRIDNLFLSAGLTANIYKNHHYKTLEDLLGGSYWLDYDQFAQNLGVSSSYQQNNLADPNKKIVVGDKFGYDYNINVNNAHAWGQAEYSIKKFDLYAGAELSTTQVWRDGFVANGKFPDDSKGKSDLISFLNYGVKGGITYKINGRNFLVANGSFLTRPPHVNSMFISQTTRNDIVQNLKSEQVGSYEFSYLAKYPGFKLRATYYNTVINNQTTLSTYWHDVYQTFVNYILTGLSETHRGVEIGIEKTLFTQHVLQGAFGYGSYYYNNNATSQSWQNNTNTQLYSARTVYIKDYKIGSTPQAVSALTYRFIGKQRWWISGTFNYFANLYTDINPDRRTQEAVDKYVSGDAQYKAVINQEKLPNFYTVNMAGNYSFRLAKGKYYLNLNGSINNLLNNKTILVRGFEQLRWDPSALDKFQNKYQYMMGLTFQASLSLSF